MSHIRSSLNLWAASLILLEVFLLGPMKAEGNDFSNENDFLARISNRKKLGNRSTEFKLPCTAQESWIFSGDQLDSIPKHSREEFQKLLTGERTPFSAFADVTGSTSFLTSAEARMFSYYWLGRALFEAKLYSEANKTFDALISIPPDHKGLPFQKAAFACIDNIHEKAPHLSYSEAALENLIQFYDPLLISVKDLDLLSRAAVQFIFQQIKTGNAKRVNKALLLIEETGQLESLVRSLWAVKQEDMGTAIYNLEKLLKKENLTPAIERRRNELTVLLARAYYDSEEYDKSIQQLENVDKSSNELVDALARLASAHLMSGNPTKAIGSAVVLNSGDFRKTFAPEALMTMAMGLTEYCRYPEAISALNDFKRQYVKPYQWLKERKENGGANNEALYPIIISYLKDQKSTVPSRVVTEWIRSPTFIAQQKGINSVYESLREIPTLKSTIGESIEIGNKELNDLNEDLADLLDDADEAVVAGKPTQVILDARLAIENAQSRLKRLKEAQSNWIRLLNSFQKNSENEKIASIEKIEERLSKITKRMFTQLTRVIANNELIEAEILTGVSKDIIMRNASPWSQKSKETRQREVTSHKGYKWRAWGEAFKGIEVWDDELGSMEANLQNKCQQTVAKRSQP